jgi:hypothetical protein
MCLEFSVKFFNLRGKILATQPLSTSCAELIIFSLFSTHHPALMQSLEGWKVELTRRRAVLVTEIGWKDVYKEVIVSLHAL